MIDVHKEKVIDVHKEKVIEVPRDESVDVAKDEVDAFVAMMLDADASKETPTQAHASCAHPMKDCRSV